MPEEHEDSEKLIRGMDAVHAGLCAGHRELLSFIAQADLWEVWRDSGARDLAHWLCMRYGISYWKALRWIFASHALQSLPLISAAFASGELGIDKVVELTRFATPETEARLIGWAQGVSCGAIRHRGDLARRQEMEEAREAERARSVEWWYFQENSRFGLSAELPAAQGAVVARALERLAEQLPVMPGEADDDYTEARRADALVALCSARIAGDADPDRASVIIHARVDGPAQGELEACEIEGGPVIHPETARRLLCNSRTQVMLEDHTGQPLRLGRISREPPAWMLRQLKYRDRERVFPGCGARRFTHAHHIVWWERGGFTDLDNLILVCAFHHKLVHEHGWRVRREGGGTVRWFRPDGTGYRAGPGPPGEVGERQPVLSAVGS